MKKQFSLLLAGTTFLLPILPFIAHAQTVQSILLAFSRVIAVMIPVAFALILLVFLWGIAKFVLSVGEEGKTEGKELLMWGTIALFIASSVWGISAYLREVIGVDGNYDRWNLERSTIPSFGSSI
jgi:hypothetical protein